jgi:hypothetical protein
MSRKYLTVGMWLLIPLVAGLALIASVAGRGTVAPITAAVAGSLGSVVTGIFTLRGLSRVDDMRTVRTGLFVQPLVGASAGLFLFLLIATHVLTLPGTETGVPGWQVAGAYGFVAGFSEAFFLGIVGRVAGAASPRSAAR